MAIFTIRSSRPASGNALAEFDVVLEAGPLAAGDEFLLFETHHPCRFVIQRVEPRRQLVTLAVSGVVPWPDRWSGVTVDTEDPRPRRVENTSPT